MVTEPQRDDASWALLTEVSESERQARMRETYVALASLPEADRRTRMLAMVRAEYALPDEQLRPFTMSRLRVWLQFPTDIAMTVAMTYDAAMEQMPGPAAMRRVALVQTLAREFSREDEAKLRQLVPRVFAGLPDRELLAAARTIPPPQPPPQRRRFWPFRRS